MSKLSRAGAEAAAAAGAAAALRRCTRRRAAAPAQSCWAPAAALLLPLLLRGRPAKLGRAAIGLVAAAARGRAPPLQPGAGRGVPQRSADRSDLKTRCQNPTGAPKETHLAQAAWAQNLAVAPCSKHATRTL